MKKYSTIPILAKIELLLTSESQCHCQNVKSIFNCNITTAHVCVMFHKHAHGLLH